jgi:hypothetical protein
VAEPVGASDPENVVIFLSSGSALVAQRIVN